MSLASLSYSSSFTNGYATGSIVAHSLSEQSKNEVVTLKNFDYIIVCKATYNKKSDKLFKYYCKNPPKKNILFMSTVFQSDWPFLILYYMRNEQ